MSMSPTTPTRSAFSFVAVFIAVVVGVIAFAAFMVLIAFADDLRRPDDGETDEIAKEP